MIEYILNLVVENDLGVLARVATVFRQKMVNIKALHVEETKDPKISNMTIRATTTKADADILYKILAQKEDVISITMTESNN